MNFMHHRKVAKDHTVHLSKYVYVTVLFGFWLIYYEIYEMKMSH